MRFGKYVCVFLLTLLFFMPFAKENNSTTKKLKRHQALNLAVKLANEKCQQQFNVSPFDTNSFEIKLADNRWKWGNLDIHGIDGFSAEVSFDLKGEKDAVKIYLSTDRLDSKKNQDANRKQKIE